MNRRAAQIAETARLHLRRFRRSDAEAMNAVFGDPKVMRFGSGTRDRDWVARWTHRCIQDYQDPTAPAVWAVVKKSSDTVIGYCGLFAFPDICGHPEVELGYRLARRFWGRGYATEAARAVRDHAFNILQLPRLISLIDPSNRRSIRVAEKLGMRYEKEVMLDGYTHPDRVYAIENRRSTGTDDAT